jgi:adenylate cyclase
MPSTRQLVAIMFTDIVGYTALMGEDEQRAFDLLRKNRQLQKPLIEQNNGTWIKELGDGVLASFPTVTDAVTAAINIQEACNQSKEFLLRIGIHQGEVVFEDGDVFGDGVNIASRLQALAPIGGIWISEAVYKNIANKKGFQTRFVREEMLKNVREPVRVYEITTGEGAPLVQPSTTNQARLTRKPLFQRRKHLALFPIAVISFLILLAMGLGYWYFSIRPPKQIQSIAVLPFVNESGNKDLEYLSDGMTETLIRSLSQLPDLNVKARSSVFRYKGKGQHAQTIGKELNVQAILNGRVVQRGEALTLYLELVDAATDNQIWGDEYTRNTSDLVSLQNEIAHDVSDKLRVKLSGDDKQKLAKNYTANSEAYQLYLRGRFYWNKRTPEELKKALYYFNQAIALDPNYALAYAGVADTYAVYNDVERGFSRDTIVQARNPAIKALSLDDKLPEAHASLGLVLFNDYDLIGAEREYKRAIELNPNYAPAHQWLALLISNLGKNEEALAEYRQALKIEPLSTVMSNAYAVGLFYARKYDESIAQSKKTLEIDSTFPGTYLNIAYSYERKGDYARTIEYYAKAREQAKDFEDAATIRSSFAKGGWQGYLRTRLTDQRTAKYPYTLARIYLRLGDRDKAIAELNRSFERREPILLRIKTDPRFDSLRSDPRFQELVRRIGFK